MKHITYNIQENDNIRIINASIRVLENGGCVIFPSDTVYGLLVDATNEKAIRKLVQFKNRPPGKPISVFVSDFEMLQKYAQVGKNQLDLLKQLLPGPFTVILKSRHKTSLLLESEKGTLGLRIPAHPFIIDLVSKLGRPVTATSANLSGKPPHYSVQSLLKELPKPKRQLIDLIIDVGKLLRNKPSTIVDLTTPTIKIIRQGDIVFTDKRTYISQSPSQTMKVASYLLQKLLKKKQRRLVFIIEGELGVGKTIFIKGIGEVLGIRNIVSPTFVIYYEYRINNKEWKNFYHFDLYEIQEKEEFKYLKIEQLLRPGNILCFEWGEKTGEILEILKKYAYVIYIKMEYIGENKREISLHYIN